MSTTSVDENAKHIRMEKAAKQSSEKICDSKESRTHLSNCTCPSLYPLNKFPILRYRTFTCYKVNKSIINPKIYLVEVLGTEPFSSRTGKTKHLKK